MKLILESLDLQAAQEQLQKKNQELVDLYREKSTKLTQMTNLYNLLKARAMRSRMETAASETVSHTLNTKSRNMPVGSLAPSGQSQIPTRSMPLPPKTPSFPMSPSGIEQLHRYQRSGTGSSRRVDTKVSNPTGMVPPGRPTLNLHNRMFVSY